jgi:hypothetical protein
MRVEVPVLLITFNRPETTKKVFERIKSVEPKALYVFNDGPRSGNPNDEALCSEVRKIVNDVNWVCTSHYNFSVKNLGCKQGVVTAISWVLEKEDRVIVIEDDVVPVIQFFYYAQELLEKYKDDDRVAMISGNNYTPINSIGSDYFFSKYGHIWGWATWKRVWDKFDVNVPDITQSIESNIFELLISNKKERKYWKSYFKSLSFSVKNNTQNAWGPQFFYFRIRNNLLSIIPASNLATNIGFMGVHTSNKTKVHCWSTDENYILKNHPTKIQCNFLYDKYHFKNHICKQQPMFILLFHFFVRVYNKGWRILGFRKHEQT